MGKCYLPIFFYLILFTNCSTKDKNEIILFNGHKYILKSGELEFKKDESVLTVSDSLKKLYNKDHLVLFKYISHKHYDTFLFIDLDSTLDRSNIYKTKSLLKKPSVFYQYILDKDNEITSITLFQNENFLKRFSEDSLGNERFQIKD